jgi:hypothetical protein
MKTRRKPSKRRKQLLGRVKENLTIEVTDDEDGGATLTFSFNDDFRNALRMLHRRKKYSKKLAKTFFEKALQNFYNEYNYEPEAEDV